MVKVTVPPSALLDESPGETLILSAPAAVLYG
jgi:hypothetical protein